VLSTLAQPSPQELSKRLTHSPEFKATVPMEEISGRKTIKEIAAYHAMVLRNAAQLTMRPRADSKSVTVFLAEAASMG